MLACVVHVFRLLWATVLFSLSQAMTRGERSVKRKRRQNSNRTRTIAGSPPLARPKLFESKKTIWRACLQAKLVLETVGNSAKKNINRVPITWEKKAHGEPITLKNFVIHVAI